MTLVLFVMGYSLTLASPNISSINNVMMLDDESFQFPECCTFVQNRYFAYFEKPDDWEGYVYVRAEGRDENDYYVSVSTFSMNKVGTASNGHEVWQWVGPSIIDEITISEIVFGGYWFNFTNGGYYSIDSEDPLGVADETILPLAEFDETITPPEGINTEEYTLIYSESRDGYSSALQDGNEITRTVQVGFNGNDVYLQGLSEILPEAWIKGTMSEDRTTIAFPNQYIGRCTTDDELSGDRFLWSMNLLSYYQMPDSIVFKYDQNEDILYLPLFIIIIESSSLGEDYDPIFYACAHISKEVPVDELITPPNDLVIEDYILNALSAYGSTPRNLKVGFYNDDVYIRGMCPELPLSWIKGLRSGEDVVFPKYQYLGTSDVINEQTGERENRKFYASAINVNTYEWEDFVLKYDEDNNAFSGTEGQYFFMQPSRFGLMESYLYYSIQITRIVETAAMPSDPSISSFEKCSSESSDYLFTFEIPVLDVNYNSMISDKLYYKVFTEVNQVASEVSFSPDDYETLQETLTLIPYDYTDGKYFCSNYDLYDGLQKSVVLKGANYPYLNKVGVQSVYMGAGETNESEISWFTPWEAIYRLNSEIYTANNLYDDENKIWGKEDLLNAINIAKNFRDDFYTLDEEAIQSYNLLTIVDATQVLKEAEKTFTNLNEIMENLANEELLAALTELNNEITKAYSIYNDDVMWYGKDELLSAIHDAENVIKELSQLSQDEIGSYDVNIILNAIQTLKEAEEAVTNNIYNVIEQLSYEISKAYDLYWDWDMMYGKDELLDAIYAAEYFRDELYNLSEEELLTYNVNLIRDAIQTLKDAEEDYIRRNNQANYIYELMDQLSSEISKAYDLYYDYDMIYGKEELLAAIQEAESIRDEFNNLDEEARQYYDAYIIRDAIQTLKDAETEYINRNNIFHSMVNQLSSEISNAYNLYNNENMKCGKEDFLNAIHTAESLLNEIYSLDEETLHSYDVNIVSEAIQTLIDAEDVFISLNTMTEEEWMVLKNYYESIDSSTWKKKWDCSSNIPLAGVLPGVYVYYGHITKIDLTGNRVSGSFPLSLLTLPYLEELNLSNNQLTGDIGEGMTNFLQNGGSLSSSISKLYLSQNQLSGNIGTFANALPSLNYLYASKNCLEDVNPIIPSTVTALSLDEQTISRVVDLNLQDISNGTIPNSIPSILLYNHHQQTMAQTLNLSFLNESGNRMSLSFENGQFEVKGSRCEYKGESGDLINTTNGNNSSTPKNCTLPIRLYFDEGDANFNGQIDILDLQTQINYMFDDYYKVFNFSAANLWKDDRINVQDAVCMVNMLLERNEATESSSRMRKSPLKNSSNNEGQLFISNGKLFVNTTSEISAFDIVVSTNEETTLSSELTSYGLTCSVRRENGLTHVIGYSLSGGSLPGGLVQLGEGFKGEVTYAMFSDKNAHEIPVSMNLTPTNISELFSDTNTSDVKFKILLGRNRAIIIDANGKKTIHQVTK